MNDLCDYQWQKSGVKMSKIIYGSIETTAVTLSHRKEKVLGQVKWMDWLLWRLVKWFKWFKWNEWVMKWRCWKIWKNRGRYVNAWDEMKMWDEFNEMKPWEGELNEINRKWNAKRSADRQIFFLTMVSFLDSCELLLSFSDFSDSSFFLLEQCKKSKIRLISRQKVSNLVQAIFFHRLLIVYSL